MTWYHQYRLYTNFWWLEEERGILKNYPHIPLKTSINSCVWWFHESYCGWQKGVVKQKPGSFGYSLRLKRKLRNYVKWGHGKERFTSFNSCNEDFKLELVIALVWYAWCPMIWTSRLSINSLWEFEAWDYLTLYHTIPFSLFWNKENLPLPSKVFDIWVNVGIVKTSFGKYCGKIW